MARLIMEGETVHLTATDTSVLISAAASGVGKGLLPMCLAEGRGDLVRVGHGNPSFTARFTCTSTLMS